VANIHRDEILKEAQLPIQYCVTVRVFRRRRPRWRRHARHDSRASIRQGRLIKVVKPEESYDELEKLTAHAEAVLQRLGPALQGDLALHRDMGFSSAKTYDIEVWAPGQGQYLEVSSCSNCEDFQARRMNLRFKSAAGKIAFLTF